MFHYILVFFVSIYNAILKLFGKQLTDVPVNNDFVTLSTLDNPDVIDETSTPDVSGDQEDTSEALDKDSDQEKFISHNPKSSNDDDEDDDQCLPQSDERIVFDSSSSISSPISSPVKYVRNRSSLTSSHVIDIDDADENLFAKDSSVVSKVSVSSPRTHPVELEMTEFTPNSQDEEFHDFDDLADEARYPDYSDNLYPEEDLYSSPKAHHYPFTREAESLHIDFSGSGGDFSGSGGDSVLHSVIDMTISENDIEYVDGDTDMEDTSGLLTGSGERGLSTDSIDNDINAVALEMDEESCFLGEESMDYVEEYAEPDLESEGEESEGEESHLNDYAVEDIDYTEDITEDIDYTEDTDYTAEDIDYAENTESVSEGVSEHNDTEGVSEHNGLIVGDLGLQTVSALISVLEETQEEEVVEDPLESDSVSDIVSDSVSDNVGSVAMEDNGSVTIEIGDEYVDFDNNESIVNHNDVCIEMPVEVIEEVLEETEFPVPVEEEDLFNNTFDNLIHPYLPDEANLSDQANLSEANLSANLSCRPPHESHNDSLSGSHFNTTFDMDLSDSIRLNFSDIEQNSEFDDTRGFSLDFHHAVLHSEALHSSRGLNTSTELNHSVGWSGEKTRERDAFESRPKDTAALSSLSRVGSRKTRSLTVCEEEGFGEGDRDGDGEVDDDLRGLEETIASIPEAQSTVLNLSENYEDGEAQDVQEEEDIKEKEDVKQIEEPDLVDSTFDFDQFDVNLYFADQFNLSHQSDNNFFENNNNTDDSMITPVNPIESDLFTVESNKSGKYDETDETGEIEGINETGQTDEKEDVIPPSPPRRRLSVIEAATLAVEEATLAVALYTSSKSNSLSNPSSTNSNDLKEPEEDFGDFDNTQEELDNTQEELDDLDRYSNDSKTQELDNQLENTQSLDVESDLHVEHVHESLEVESTEHESIESDLHTEYDFEESDVHTEQTEQIEYVTETEDTEHTEDVTETEDTENGLDNVECVEVASQDSSDVTHVVNSSTDLSTDVDVQFNDAFENELDVFGHEDVEARVEDSMEEPESECFEDDLEEPEYVVVSDSVHSVDSADVDSIDSIDSVDEYLVEVVDVVDGHLEDVNEKVVEIVGELVEEVEQVEDVEQVGDVEEADDVEISCVVEDVINGIEVVSADVEDVEDVEEVEVVSDDVEGEIEDVVSEDLVEHEDIVGEIEEVVNEEMVEEDNVDIDLQEMEDIVSVDTEESVTEQPIIIEESIEEESVVEEPVEEDLVEEDVEEDLDEVSFSQESLTQQSISKEESISEETQDKDVENEVNPGSSVNIVVDEDYLTPTTPMIDVSTPTADYDSFFEDHTKPHNLQPLPQPSPLTSMYYNHQYVEYNEEERERLASLQASLHEDQLISASNSPYATPSYKEKDTKARSKMTFKSLFSRKKKTETDASQNRTVYEESYDDDLMENTLERDSSSFLGMAQFQGALQATTNSRQPSLSSQSSAYSSHSSSSASLTHLSVNTLENEGEVHVEELNDINETDSFNLHDFEVDSPIANHTVNHTTQFLLNNIAGPVLGTSVSFSSENDDSENHNSIEDLIVGESVSEPDGFFGVDGIVEQEVSEVTEVTEASEEGEASEVTKVSEVSEVSEEDDFSVVEVEDLHTIDESSMEVEVEDEEVNIQDSNTADNTVPELGTSESISEAMEIVSDGSDLESMDTVGNSDVADTISENSIDQCENYESEPLPESLTELESVSQCTESESVEESLEDSVSVHEDLFDNPPIEQSTEIDNMVDTEAQELTDDEPIVDDFDDCFNALFADSDEEAVEDEGEGEQGIIDGEIIDDGVMDGVMGGFGLNFTHVADEHSSDFNEPLEHSDSSLKEDSVDSGVDAEALTEELDNTSTPDSDSLTFTSLASSSKGLKLSFNDVTTYSYSYTPGSGSGSESEGEGESDCPDIEDSTQNSNTNDSVSQKPRFTFSSGSFSETESDLESVLSQSTQNLSHDSTSVSNATDKSIKFSYADSTQGQYSYNLPIASPAVEEEPKPNTTATKFSYADQPQHVYSFTDNSRGLQYSYQDSNAHSFSSPFVTSPSIPSTPSLPLTNPFCAPALVNIGSPTPVAFTSPTHQTSTHQTSTPLSTHSVSTNVTTPTGPLSPAISETNAALPKNSVLPNNMNTSVNDSVDSYDELPKPNISSSTSETKPILTPSPPLTTVPAPVPASLAIPTPRNYTPADFKFLSPVAPPKRPVHHQSLRYTSNQFTLHHVNSDLEQQLEEPSDEFNPSKINPNQPNIQQNNAPHIRPLPHRNPPKTNNPHQNLLYGRPQPHQSHVQANIQHNLVSESTDNMRRFANNILDEYGEGNPVMTAHEMPPLIALTKRD